MVYSQIIRRLSEKDIPMTNPEHEQAHIHYVDGSKLYFAKQFEEAIDKLSQAIELNPQYYKAYDRRGSVYKRLGKFDQALQDFNRALEINPTFHRAYRNRGHVFRDTNFPIAAVADFESSKKYIQDEEKKELLDRFIREINSQNN